MRVASPLPSVVPDKTIGNAEPAKVSFSLISQTAKPLCPAHATPPLPHIGGNAGKAVKGNPARRLPPPQLWLEGAAVTSNTLSSLGMDTHTELGFSSSS